LIELITFFKVSERERNTGEIFGRQRGETFRDQVERERRKEKGEGRRGREEEEGKSKEEKGKVKKKKGK